MKIVPLGYFALSCASLGFGAQTPAPASTVAAAPADAQPRSERMVSDARLAELQANLAKLSPDDALELGLAYDERHNGAQAAESYTRAAAAGIGVAELRLGALDETGESVPQNYATARAHYQRAIDLGVPEGHLRLGLLDLEGWGVPSDRAAAARHILAAAEAGNITSQRIVSQMYFIGLGVPKDAKLALQWAERAAAAGDPLAQTTAGHFRQLARRLPSELAAARAWYQLSAQQDYTRGMFAMASSFLQPGATADDVRLGRRWLELAATGGNSAAAFYLAGLLLVPQIEVDGDRIAQARALLEQSADAGEFAAIYVLRWADQGHSLAEAFAYVMSTDVGDVYLQNLATDPRFIEDANGDRAPRPLRIPQPTFPEALRLTMVDGRAEVQFVVDKLGRPQNARVISATHPAFGEEALKAVLASDFAPGMRHGQCVNMVIRLPMVFKISEIETGKKESKSTQPATP